jgi:hypothetical protein
LTAAINAHSKTLFSHHASGKGRACSSSALPFTHPNIDDENLTMQQDLDLDDVFTLEGTSETDVVDYFVTLQRAINSGLWQLQGALPFPVEISLA